MKEPALPLATIPAMLLLVAACGGSPAGGPLPASSPPTGEAILVREYAPERHSETTLLPTPTQTPRGEDLPPVLPPLPEQVTLTPAPRTPSSPAAPTGDKRKTVPSKSIQSSAQRILYVGDSLAVGSQQSLTRELGTRQVHLETRVGMTTAEGVEAVRDAPPSDVVIVDLGTNDFSPETFAHGVENMMTVASGRTVVWVNVARPRAADINRVLQRASRQHSNLVVLDWRSASKQNPEWLANDHIHYTSAGYSARGSFIAAAID